MADPIERAADLLRRIDPRPVGAHDAARAKFLHAVQAPRPSPLRWAIPLAAAAAALAVFAVVNAPLTYTVGASAVHEGGWVRANEAPAEVRFSDGTRFELKAGGQAEIVSTDARGAVVRVSSGVLSAQVVHRVASRWQVQAGPYAVRVTGTKFTTSRIAEDEVEVELLEGSVEVSGPGLAAPLQLKAGQRFHASLERSGARVEVSSLEAVEKPAPQIAKPRPPLKPAGWRVKVAAGDFDGVVQAARAEGLEVALRRDADEVFGLGEAARYLKDAALAERSFLTVRRRFPRTPEAAHAALLLGDVAEQQARWADANQWYQQCEADGQASLLPEALGRRLRVLEQLKHHEEARALALRYLQLDPSGPWAAVARRTLE